jgi:hypothetical protein
MPQRLWRSRAGRLWLKLYRAIGCSLAKNRQAALRKEVLSLLVGSPGLVTRLDASMAYSSSNPAKKQGILPGALGSGVYPFCLKMRQTTSFLRKYEYF